eukprot:CAMPEP_0172545724 /NCGR_PEP_ID=MMETSP1067-20121228/15591_1 /TAXON_ID=265564 ORGANISM="Thalassiosira punctigera, Strain Tpunct2005C2" /NCGR_SAMPLE_ID=MMETSP1067 /ASSEMBLY_ACC=CAM_ASM_000444 /LENGTH=297 /DNA_ID=CAMNT_0013332519 /DNA_START=3 /DNA_END=893 /DNA_ORIENTATION=-
MFEPVWYGRGDIWTGQTHKEAVDFCNAMINTKKEPMMLCPFDAYCPKGANSVPYGGIKEETAAGSWAPVINGHNSWVELGNERKCRPYSEIYPEEPAPEWGITGRNNEEITRHVLCCRSRASHLSAGETGGGADGDVAANAALVESAVAQVTEGIVVEGEMQLVYGEIYGRVDHNLQPTPHDRLSGWTGQTYDEAREFCGRTESKEPCTYEALCPNGVGNEQNSMGMTFMEGQVWAPIDDGYDAGTWAELREEGRCIKHTVLEPYSDVTRFVLCCKTAGEALGPTQDHGPIPFSVVY